MSGRADLAVGRAAADDLDALVEILLAMERHYEPAVLPAPDTVRTRIAAALFGPAPIALAWLARGSGDGAVGVAMVNWLYPTKEFLPGLFLKDLYVLPSWRGRGVARALLAALADFARENGSPRIDWTTDRGNEAAARLYRRLGAGLEDKHFFRVRQAGYNDFITHARDGTGEA